MAENLARPLTQPPAGISAELIIQTFDPIQYSIAPAGLFALAGPDR
jgi:hypothetical protein